MLRLKSILTGTSARRAVQVGLFVGVAHYVYHQVTHDWYPGDYYLSLQTAYDLLHGINPYDFIPNPSSVPYPLPSAVFGIMLLWILNIAPMVVAGSAFAGISAGLLTWAMLRAGETWRLAAILLSAPFWAAVMMAQWSPLIVTAWFLPVLGPLLLLVKPHITLPVVLVRRPSWLGLLIAAVVLLASLIIMPTWPVQFLGVVWPYQAIVPATILPYGPLVLLAALRWRNERSQLLTFMAMMPQRAPYDTVGLWLISETPLQAAALSAFSWLVMAAFYSAWIDLRWSILLPYLAVLVCTFWPVIVRTLRWWRIRLARLVPWLLPGRRLNRQGQVET